MSFVNNIASGSDPASHNVSSTHLGGRGLPYKSDGGDRRKF